MWITIAVCDDDAGTSGYLADLLRKNAGLLPEPFRIRLFNEGTALASALPFDIIFLDSAAGDGVGIRGTGAVRERRENTMLVFVSSPETYCRKPFRFDTAAFLEKPITEEHLREILPRLSERLAPHPNVFAYSVKQHIRTIPLDDIRYFESKGRQIEIVTSRNRELFYGKLSDTEKTLNAPGFARIHHSFLVNLDAVEDAWDTGIIVKGGDRLPIAQRKKQEIRRILKEYHTGGAAEVPNNNPITF